MEPGDAGHLDELIGEIRREAARRRAAPSFPVDEEAGIGVELDALGPAAGGADLAASLAGLRALAAARPGGDGDPSLRELAALTAAAVQALAVRLDYLERRRPDPSGAADPPGPH